jgi:hypothetical protein
MKFVSTRPPEFDYLINYVSHLLTTHHPPTVPYTTPPTRSYTTTVYIIIPQLKANRHPSELPRHQEVKSATSKTKTPSPHYHIWYQH